MNSPVTNTSRLTGLSERRRATEMTSLPLSVVILTKNEEANLPRCLDSVEGISTDVHVLDSSSEDATTVIARARGVSVYTNPFLGFGIQRNWAIDNVRHRYEWVFHLDADERFTPDLAEEIRRVLAADPQEAGFLVPSKLMLGGRWLRRSSGYPVYQCRLFHRERLRFADHGHGQREIARGPLGTLSEAYLHDAFSKGLDDWFVKHVGYARKEAEQGLSESRAGILENVLGLATRDRVRRRRAIKTLSHRLPARSTLRFFEIYLLRMGFLDGRPGLAYARMLAAYEAMTSAYLAAASITDTRGDAVSF